MSGATTEWLLVGMEFEVAFAVSILAVVVWIARNKERFGIMTPVGPSRRRRRRDNKRKDLEMQIEEEGDIKRMYGLLIYSILNVI